MLTLLVTMTIILFALGVVYPVGAILVFPIYSRITGDRDFFRYLKNL